MLNLRLWGSIGDRLSRDGVDVGDGMTLGVNGGAYLVAGWGVCGVVMNVEAVRGEMGGRRGGRGGGRGRMGGGGSMGGGVEERWGRGRGRGRERGEDVGADRWGKGEGKGGEGNRGERVRAGDKKEI
ncbi:hypothetical protein Tco_0535284 [Tanacetum coccineum]